MLKMSDNEYRRIRREIYQPIREEKIFHWDIDPYDQNEYGLATIYEVSEAFLLELKEATEQMGAIFNRMILAVQKEPNELFNQLGLPKETWNIVRLIVDEMIPTLLGRFDFAYTKEGFKLLEFNSDTPVCFVEAYYVNKKICDYYGWENPNERMVDHIKVAFHRMVEVYQQQGYLTKNIFFTSATQDHVDTGNTQFLMNASGLEARFAPLDQLVLKKDKLYVRDHQGDQPIDVWFRLYAMEYLALDKVENDFPFGKYILHLMSEGKLASINPPSSFIAQTKALQALIWQLFEDKEFFTEREQEAIERYMLPTYLDNRFLLGKKSYVEKPILGRFGGGITIYNQDGTIHDRDIGAKYWQQTMVYQEKVELETVETTTLLGDYRGKLVWGSFLIDGKASAITTRLSETITQDDMCYFLPIGIKR